MSVNKVILIGNVGKDANIVTFANGNQVADFSFATSETYTNKSGEKVTNTEWHNIKCFQPLADIAGKFVKKGMQIYIEGKIKTESWGEGEAKKYKTYIIADTFRFLSAKQNEQKPQEPQSVEVIDNEPFDDMPF